MTKTTPANFAYFSECVKAWQIKLGLTDWDIQLRHMPRQDALATTLCNGSGRVATIILATNWPNDPITDERILRTAIHEVLHVLLFDIVWIGECRYVTDSELPVAEHSVIRRLERLLVDA